MKISEQANLSSVLILVAATAIAMPDSVQEFMQSEENQAMGRDILLIAAGGMLVGKGIKECLDRPDVLIDWS